MPSSPSDEDATRQLAQALYTDLRRIARGVRRGGNGADETLQTTALINEAYLKLYQGGAWQTREHFMNAAATAMRQALIDHARARLSSKRGGDRQRVEFEAGTDLLAVPEESLIELDEALHRLARLDERLARIVDCRYFAGYNEDETATALGISARTVQREWARARAWLFRELNP